MSYTVIAHFCSGKPIFGEWPSLAGISCEGSIFYPNKARFDGGVMVVAFDDEMPGIAITPQILIDAICADFAHCEPTMIAVHKTDDNELCASWTAKHIF